MGKTNAKPPFPEEPTNDDESAWGATGRSGLSRYTGACMRRRPRAIVAATCSGREVRAIRTASAMSAGRQSPNFSALTISSGSVGCAVVGSTFDNARLKVSISPVSAVRDTSSHPAVDTSAWLSARASEADTRPPAKSHAVTFPSPSETSGKDRPSMNSQSARISLSLSAAR
jgi:hypothetical protein